jgi:hypothetical protein
MKEMVSDALQSVVPFHRMINLFSQQNNVSNQCLVTNAIKFGTKNNHKRF